MNTVEVIALGAVAVAYGLWVYLSPSAERFYLSRPYLLATTGWILTGVLPFGAGVCVVGFASMFPKGSLLGQIGVGSGLVLCLLGFGLILIHPDWVRPRWLRGKVGE